MKTKLTKYGMLIVAAVLLVAMAFAGAASAAPLTDVQNYTELKDAFTDASGGAKLIADIEISTTETPYIYTSKTLDLNGYNITMSSPSYKFVNVQSGANLIITDTSGNEGTIQGYNADYCLKIEGGNIILNKGKITNFKGGDAGAVYIYAGGTFTMNGGSITNCKFNGGGYGSAVRVDDGTFIMTGGSITGCSANSGTYGAVYVSSSGTFKVNGTATITGNTDAYGSPNNVYLDGTDRLTLLAGGFTGSIGISNPEGGKFGTAEAGATGEANFVYDKDSGLEIIKDGSNNLLIPIIDVNSWADLKSQVESYNGTKMLIIRVTTNIDSTETDYGFGGIEVYGNITIMPKTSSVIIDAKKMGRLFKVSKDGSSNIGSLTLKGNGAATLTLKNGNYSTGNGGTRIGGGVKVEAGAKLTLATGGIITECKSGESGGGVHVKDAGSTFTMTGGTISGCSAGNYGGGNGGGVAVENSGTFTMTDGTITGCSTLGGRGGGVFVKGTSTMTGGTISGCSAARGGGVAIENNGGSFTMTGGTISGCSAGNYGGGVYVKDSATFSMGGTALVEANNDVYLAKYNADYAKIIPAATFQQGHFGAFNITPGNTASDAVIVDGSNKITVSTDNFALSSNLRGLSLVKDGNNNLVLDKVYEVSSWAELNESINGYTKTKVRTILITDSFNNNINSTGDDYEGIPVTGNITIMPASSSKSVTIDAKQTGRLFDVKSGGDLTLKGNGAATLTLTGGNKSDDAGAIYTGNNGRLTLADGAIITGCSANSNGGGVNVGTSGTFTMTGGSITGCRASSGGGVYLYKGSFTMTGGTITGCSTPSTSGGVCVLFGSTFIMNGTALVDANNDIYLDFNQKITIGAGGFSTGHYGAFNITPNTMTAGTLIVDGTVNSVQASTDNFKLSSNIRGLMLVKNGYNLVLEEFYEISSWEDLNASINGYDGTKMRTILITDSFINNISIIGSNYAGIPVTANITIMPASSSKSVTIDAAQTGRLFNVSSGGNLTLKGNGAAELTLTGGKINDDGGGIYVDAGKFTLLDGAKITSCKATSYKSGGGVYVTNGGTFTMDGGSITTGASDTMFGGCVCVNANSTFIMNGGTITGTASSNGGGVCVNKDGIFTMTGGTITGCNAPNGGGVYSEGTFTMTGGTITKCSGVNDGHGVYVSSKCSFTMNGTALVTGDNDVYLSSGKTITLGAGGFQLGHYGAFSITPSNTGAGTFVVEGKTGNVPSMDNFALSPAYTTANNMIAAPSITGIELALKPATVVNSWTELRNNATGTGIKYILVNDNITCTETGPNYDGIAITGNIIIMPASASVSIDANQKGRLFKITGGDLTLRGNGDRTLTLKNGKQSDDGGAIFINTGYLNLANGVIITECSADWGGAVARVEYNEGEGVAGITMTGGTITGCSATSGGGALYTISIPFNVSGTATVIGNTVNGVANNAVLDSINIGKKSKRLILTGPFIGTIGISKPETENNGYFGIIQGTGDEAGAKNLISDTHAGYGGIKESSSIKWGVIQNSAKPSTDGTAVFGNNNITNLTSDGASKVSYVILDEVSNLDSTTTDVKFYAINQSTVPELPAVNNNEAKNLEISIFEVNATGFTSGNAVLKISVLFKSEADANANKGNARFWHYNSSIGPTGDWDTPALSSTIAGQNGAMVTYLVTTKSFSPFGVGLYASSGGGSPSYSGGSSSSKNYGGSMWTENPNPTVAPTAAPTAAPVYDTPTQAPTTQPTTKQTQKSPAPVAGLIAGLGIAALGLARLRR